MLLYFRGSYIFCACFNHITQPGDPQTLQASSSINNPGKGRVSLQQNVTSIKKPQKMFSLRRHILMLKFLHSYPCLAMQSVTKCTRMWVFLSKSSYCNHLRLVVYPIIYRVLYPRWLFRISEPSTVTCQVVRETRQHFNCFKPSRSYVKKMWFLCCVGFPRLERQQTHGAPGYLGYQGWRSEIFEAGKTLDLK